MKKEIQILGAFEIGQVVFTMKSNKIHTGKVLHYRIDVKEGELSIKYTIEGISGTHSNDVYGSRQELVDSL